MVMIALRSEPLGTQQRHEQEYGNGKGDETGDEQHGASRPIQREGIGGKSREHAGAKQQEQEVEHGRGSPEWSPQMQPHAIRIPFGLGSGRIRIS
jgi:hypothetical protein